MAKDGVHQVMPKRVLLFAGAVALLGLLAWIASDTERTPAAAIDKPGASVMDESPEAELTAAGYSTPAPEPELSASESRRFTAPEPGTSRQNQQSAAPAPSMRQAAWDTNRIDVTVRDSTGQPVDMARVIPEGVSGRRIAVFHKAAAFSEPDGFARISDLPEGWVRVTVSKVGFAPTSSAAVELSAMDNVHELEILLTAGGTVVGTVLDANGEAAERVQVSIRLNHVRGATLQMFTALDVQQDCFTEADGTFRFELLPPGRYRVDVNADARSQASGPVLRASVDVAVVDGQTTEAIFEDHSGSAVRVSGSVICNGKPLSNTLLEVDPFGFKWSGMDLSTRTDESGHFEQIVPESGECTFSLELEDGVHVYRAFTIPAARTFEIEIVFQTGRISGRVVGPDGEPRAGISVWAHGGPSEGKRVSGSMFVNSNSDGAFEFVNLPLGAYRIEGRYRIGTVYDRGQLLSTIRGPVNARPEHPLVGPGTMEGVEVGAEVILSLSSAAAIEGDVLGTDGKPVNGGCVRVWPLGGSQSKDTTEWGIDENGSVLAGGLAPGDYMVRAESRHDVSPWYSLKAEADRVTPWEFVLARGTLIRITATAGGEPVSGRFVHAVDPRGMPEPFDKLVAGSALLGPVAPGTYAVRIGSEGSKLPFVQKTIVVTGEEFVDVLLELP